MGIETHTSHTHPASLAILRLDIGGIPTEWIDAETAAGYYAKDLVGWTHGAPITELHGGYNRKGVQSLLELHPVIAIKGKTYPRRYTPPLSNPTLFQRDANLCLYCGERFSSGKLTRDHIIPVSRGGQDAWTNVVSACRACNNHKSARTPEQAGMPLLAVPYAPNPFEYLYLIRNRRISADQLEFLSAGFRSERLF